jgi:hypothetical protein
VDRAEDEYAGRAEREDGGGKEGTPNSHDDLHASTEAAACELVLAATPGLVHPAGHRQSSADYKK